MTYRDRDDSDYPLLTGFNILTMNICLLNQTPFSQINEVILDDVKIETTINDVRLDKPKVESPRLPRIVRSIRPNNNNTVPQHPTVQSVIASLPTVVSSFTAWDNEDEDEEGTKEEEADEE